MLKLKKKNWNKFYLWFRVALHKLRHVHRTLVCFFVFSFQPAEFLLHISKARVQISV